MLKINSSNTTGFFVKYIVRVIISTVLSVLLLSSVVSYLFVKLDLSIELLMYSALIITSASSIIISQISLIGIKNNLLVLSILSTLPLCVYTFIAFIADDNADIKILLNIILIVLFSAISAIIKSKKLR